MRNEPESKLLRRKEESLVRSDVSSAILASCRKSATPWRRASSPSPSA
jgi:hypothetical protein